MEQTLRHFVAMGLVSLMLVGCGESSTPPTTSVAIIIQNPGKAALAPKAAMKPATAFIDAFKVTVTGPNMGLIEKISSGGSANFNLTIPNGENRLFVVEGRTAAGKTIFRGEHIHDLNGTPISISIDIAPVNFTKVFFSPDDQTTIAAGQTLTKSIQVFGLQEAASVSFDLMYNPAILQYVGTSEGDFFNQANTVTTSFSATNQSLLGKVTVNLSRPTDITGSGTLMTLSFQGVAAGTSTLGFANPQFQNKSGGMVIIDDWEGGSIIIGNPLPITLQNLSILTGASAKPSAAMDGNNVVVVWQDDPSGTSTIFFRRSTDGGVTFGTTTNLSGDLSAPSTNPSVAISGLNVVVAWECACDGTVIYFSRSTDGGANFATSVPISNFGTARTPSIAISSNHVVVAWEERNVMTPFNPQIRSRHSADAGANFDPEVTLSDTNSPSDSPSVAISGSNVMVVWRDQQSSDFIVSRRSTDGGVNFEPIRPLSTGGGASNPSIAISGSNVITAWEYQTFEIASRSSIDAGANFSLETNLSNNAGSSLSPSVAISGSNVIVGWQDNTLNTLGAYDVFFAQSRNGGGVFDPSRNLVSGDVNHFDISAAISGNINILVWHERDPQNNNHLFLMRIE